MMKKDGDKIIFENAADLPDMAKSMGTTRFNKTGTWRNEKPIVDTDKCTGCGICWKYCPDMSILEDENGKAAIDYEFCKGCAICVEVCPVKAISMVEEEK